MRICIDARSLRDTPTGLGRYAAHLVSHISRLDQQNEYIVIRRPSRHGTIAEQDNFREIAMSYDISSLRNTLGGARIINALQADIYHSLFHFLPLGVEAGQIVISLHDLIWVDHPRLADNNRLKRWAKGSLGKLGIRNAIRTADHIIAVSASTRQAALDDHALAAEKVTAIHHGVAPEWGFGFDNAETELPEIYRDRRFIFGLGNSLPYKNLPRLVRAFAELATSDPDLLLVLAGRGEGNPQLVQLAHQLGLSDRIHLAGQLSDAQIRTCFTRALFFAFPSLIEGFGMPVLEAMASGCPVLTSNRSSLAEIAGNDAELVNPDEIGSIAAGMRRLLTNSALRQHLGRQGQERAATFTWERTAHQTIQVYNRLVSAHYRAP